MALTAPGANRARQGAGLASKQDCPLGQGWPGGEQQVPLGATTWVGQQGAQSAGGGAMDRWGSPQEPIPRVCPRSPATRDHKMTSGL